METSAEIKNISKALAEFHAKVGKIKKTSNNPFFKSKYASLPDILDNIADPLTECGLIVTQHPEGEHDLTTMVIHADSGEFLKSTYNMSPVKNDPQSIGSCITYQRRYAIGSILSLNIDEDDDSNAATAKGATPIIEQKPVAPKAKPAELPTITDERVKKACEMIVKDLAVRDSLLKSFTLTLEQHAQINDAVELYHFNNDGKEVK